MIVQKKKNLRNEIQVNFKRKRNCAHNFFPPEDTSQTARDGIHHAEEFRFLFIQMLHLLLFYLRNYHSFMKILCCPEELFAS
jgi:hypothetical protein